MKKLIALVMLLGCGATQAALIDRGNGLIYDDFLDVTWLSDTNLAASNSFGVSGIDASGVMSWDTANAWIAAMNSDGGVGYLGFNQWRLSSSVFPDAGCDNDGSGAYATAGYGCTASEFGHLFYSDLGVPGDGTTNMLTNGDPDAALFSNLWSVHYWTSSEFSTDTDQAWTFTIEGSQHTHPKTINAVAWAVADGDVAASVVPIPAAVWLFGSGLGLLGWMRRRQAA